MAHNAIDGKQGNRESRLWIASRRYVTGEIDINELEEIEKDYTEAFNHAMMIISKRNLSYHFQTKLRNFLKPKGRNGENLPSSRPYVQ